VTHLANALFDEAAGNWAPTKMRFRVSASQLKMFHPGAGGCPRKWALHYLAHVPRIPGPALTDGIRLHECIAQRFQLSADEWAKRWPTFWREGLSLEDQARVKTAQLALAMIEQTPPGSMPPISESTDMLEVPELDTAFYIKPDLHRDRAIFVDWKSTGSVSKRDKYVLQDPEWYKDAKFIKADVKFLKDDIQARLYAHGLMTMWHEVRIKARWVYGSKKFDPGDRPKVWIVEHTFQRAETREWVEANIWPTVKVMNTIRAAWEAKRLDSPLLIPHVGESCGFTGRFCDALGYCGFKPSPIPLGKFALPVLPGTH
jgi:hypothetical protein